ncbi:hypothetical protein [Amycolatopsis alkalitolerans]|uniref:WXG100 family type VII secretion target n=1 Tax=Amycolatopsis alkalitolerans TaxID=2547244 RepID=A0A5C4M7B8_9PSEU|nr:hypothetical protein [Amycolatopsis alkalitolerans]TNC28731.1 hypothetical protein FG385_05650 [Amycolatopsis alkalitolerans]
MAKTWPEVKKLLDDPSVPPEQKTILLSSWQQENKPPLFEGLPATSTQAERDEAAKYADVYGSNPMMGFQGTDAAYVAAKQAGDQASYNEREEKKAVDDGKTQLDGKQAPAPGGTGTKTSDELFDAAEPALKLFQTFGSLLAKIPDDCRGNTRPLDYNNDIKKRFDEQRGISFANFLDDADHFKTGSTTVDGTVKDTGSALSTLFHTWTGSGANAASDHYNDQILPKANKLGQTLEDANTATTTAVSTLFRLCKGKADAVVNMYTDQVGQADYNMAQKVVGVANGEHAGKDDLRAIAGWMDMNFGTNLTDALDDDGCCDDDDIKKQGQDLAKQWIQNHFNPDMWDRLYKGFDKTCTDTKDLVNQAYDALDGVMGKIKNEFEGAAEPPGQTQPSQTQPSQTQPSQTSTGTGGGGGGASTPSATTPSATTPSTEDPSAIADAAKKEASEGINPYTGKPMETDPQTGQPYPIDPKTGEPIKDAGGEPETMKVQQGDKTIEMSEPDKDGKMDVKVGDGSGQPKDYKLDWGDGKDTSGAQSAPAAGQPGPDGTYKPGPDGKIHIEDGNVKITAERPQGPDGPTVVTVDDGSGHPATYTLGEDKNGAPDAQSMVGKDDGSAPRPGDAATASSGVPGSAPAPPVESAAAVGGDGATAPDTSSTPADVGGTTPDGAGATAPATSADGLSAVGAGVGGAEGSVSGSLGDAASLGEGTHTGATLHQPTGAALGAPPPGMQPVGTPDAAASQQQTPPGGGMGGMGGMMGGMGAAGGGGEDQERSSRSYRIDGGIFNSGGNGGRISGSLDEEGDRSVTQR